MTQSAISNIKNIFLSDEKKRIRSNKFEKMKESWKEEETKLKCKDEIFQLEFPRS